MDNNKAMALSATMVGVAAIASGAFFFSSLQVGAADDVVVPQPAEVIVEYVDATGTRFEVPTTYETAVPATSETPPQPEYQTAEYEEYEEGEHDEEQEEEEHEDDD